MTAGSAGRQAGADGLQVLTVDLGPGVRAAFTTRAGGVSPSPWDSLNLGLGVLDDPARVRRNRDRVAAWAGVPVAYATQVHGRAVARVSAPPAADTVGEADSLVATTPEVAVAVLVADCVPVLLADAAGGVVAAVHAGRSGLVAGVVEAALGAMQESGAVLERVRAVVGPAIAAAAYEVPAQLRDEVARTVPGTWATTSSGTPALDLPAGVVGVLRRAGVARVEQIGVCTTRDERFYSYRQARGVGTVTGRFAGVVRLLG